MASPVAPPPRAPASLLLSAFAPVLRVRAVIIIIVAAAVGGIRGSDRAAHRAGLGQGSALPWLPVYLSRKSPSLVVWFVVCVLSVASYLVVWSPRGWRI